VAQTEAAAWTVAADGDIAVGGPKAVGLMIAIAWQRRWPLWLWRVPGAPWLLDRIYEWIARHRRRFPGEIPWCRANPGECEPIDAVEG
jgi:predicted DCC family thiol-disulfide oxidoreductase YuxK